jgi:hypothetical protein
MGSKTTGQTNSSQTYTPPPQVMQNYQAVTSQAQNVAATPFQSFSGQLVAPVNQQQEAGINAVNEASGIQDPFNDAAGGLAASSATPINPETVNANSIEQYESPFQSQVVNATEAEINNENAQQASSLAGNAISSGAFGGDRAGVAQAALAGQQDIASDATLANLNNQNYSQALGEANTEQTAGMTAQEETAQNQNTAANTLANVGNTAQTEALNEANAQTNAGTLEQTTQQAQDTASYNQFLQQEAYPFETTGWLANIVEGIGSQSGGTTTGTSTTQGSTGSEIAGGLLGLGGIINGLARGGRVYHRGNGGGIYVPHRATGGGLADGDGGGIYMPQYDPTGGAGPTGLGGGSFVPQTGPLQVGNTMPKGIQPTQSNSQTPQQQAQTMAQTAKDVQGLGSGISSLYNKFSNAGGPLDISDGMGGAGAVGDSDPLAALGDPIYSRGGIVPRSYHERASGGLVGRRPHYDSGGIIPDDSSEDLLFDPNAVGAPTVNSGAFTGPAVSPTPVANNQPAPNVSLGYGIAPGVSQITPTPAQEASAPQSVPASSNMGFDLSPEAPLAATVASGSGSAPQSSPGLASAGASPGIDTGGLNPQARGMRNNNPGNLVANNWTSSLPGYEGSDGRFAIFSTPQDGAAALDRNLQSYGAQGLSTPLQIASRWAPAGDGGNDPSAYAGVIAKNLGVGVNDPIDLNDPAQRARVGSAISLMENGRAGAGSGLASAGPDPDLPAPGAHETSGILSGLSNLFGGANSDQQAADTGQAPAERRGLLGLTPEQGQELMDVGLGIMGGTSRSALVNIGEGGLAGISAYNQNQNTQSEVGLRNAQALSTMTDAEINQVQLKRMLDELEGQEKEKTAAAKSAPNITSPSVTAPTVAGAAPQISLGGDNLGSGAGAPAANAPDATTAAQLDATLGPAYRAALGDSLSTFPQFAESGRVRLAQAQSQLPEGYAWDANGHVVANPAFISQKAAEASAVTGATQAAVNAARPGVDPGTGVSYVGGTPQNGSQPSTISLGSEVPSAFAANSGAPQSAASIDPNTATIHRAIPPAPPGGGYIVPNLPAGARATSDAPANVEQRKADGEYLQGMPQAAQAADTVIARTQALAQAFKTFTSGPLANTTYGAARVAVALGRPDIAQSIMSGDPAGVEWVEKEGVNSVLDTLRAATPRFAQSEFNKISEVGTPNPTNLPESNHEMVAEMLAMGERQKDFQSDWQSAKQQGWTSPSAFYNAWSTANPLNSYIKAAQRQVGNFSGMPLPPASDWAQGVVYTAPTNPSPAVGSLLQRYGVKPGAMFRFNGRAAPSPIQPIPQSGSFSAQLGGQ